MKEKEDQQNQEAKSSTEDRALYPRSPQEVKDRTLRWAQVWASTADAIARLAEVVSRFIR